MRLRAAWLLAGLLAACADRPMTLPPDPPALVALADYGFGDQVAAADWRAQRRVLDTLEPRFADLRVLVRQRVAETAPAELQLHYARVLGEGWSPLPDLSRPSPGGGYAFGFQRGDRVFAVVGLAGPPPAPAALVTNLAAR